MSPVADVEADASSGSGLVVTDTASMARVACVPKLASLELPPCSGECILGGICWAPNLVLPRTLPVSGIRGSGDPHPCHLEDKQGLQLRASGRSLVIACPSRNYSLAHTAPQAQTPKPSSSMPRTSCLGRPSPGALTTWALVGQTFQSQSMSVWTAGVQFGCTPPGIPLQTVI